MSFADTLPLTKVWPFCLYQHTEETIADALNKNLSKDNGKLDREKLMLLLAKVIKVQTKVVIENSGYPADDFYR